MGSSAPPLREDSVFAEYHREFTSFLSATTNKISEAQTQAPDTATISLNNADESLQEASSLVKSMELESQSQNSQTRSALQPHISACRDAVSTARTSLRLGRIALAQRKDDSNRESLLGDDEERFKLLDTTRDLERGSERILDSRRHIAETESVGASILQDLQDQRMTIQRARQSVGNVDTGLDQSTSIISTMHRRAVINKIIIYVVLGGIAVACLGVVYVRLFNSQGK